MIVQIKFAWDLGNIFMFGTFIYNFFAFVQDNCRTQWWSNDGNLGVVHSHIQRLNAFQPLNLEKVTNRVINDVRIIFRQLDTTCSLIVNSLGRQNELLHCDKNLESGYSKFSSYSLIIFNIWLEWKIGLLAITLLKLL